MKFLDEAEYAHLAEQFQELARQDDPTRSLVVSVDAIEEFHELRDKGGVLAGKNVRVFYYVDKRSRSIVRRRRDAQTEQRTNTTNRQGTDKTASAHLPIGRLRHAPCGGRGVYRSCRDRTGKDRVHRSICNVGSKQTGERT